MSRDLLLLRGSIGVLFLASSVCCATATATSKLRRVEAPRGMATRLVDLRLELGTECVVTLTDGSVLRGRLESLSADTLGINTEDRDKATGTRVLPEGDLMSVGRVVGKSKPARAWLGAGVGLLVSLPLSISMVGDRMIPAALIGTWVGRNTGDERIELLFERVRPPPREPPMPVRRDGGQKDA